MDHCYRGLRLGGDQFVTCDGKVVSPNKSLKVRRHSPAGFNWGYGGSGPAQLALAMLLIEKNEPFALAAYQDFKRDRISKLNADEWVMSSMDIRIWCRLWLELPGNKAAVQRQLAMASEEDTYTIFPDGADDGPQIS